MDYFFKKKTTYFEGVFGHYPKNEIFSQKSQFFTLETPKLHEKFQKNPIYFFGENAFTYGHSDSGEIIGPLFA